jgi:hypothetical protein
VGSRRAFSRRIVLGFAGALVAVVALSWLVGKVGGTHGFDWDLAAVFGTALGTTLLAITTGGLAYLTGREVSATKELAQLTRADQVARERPVVILHTAVFREQIQGEGHISLQVFNAGLGPALRVEIKATYKDPAHQPTMPAALWPVIMAGQREDFAIQPVVFTSSPPGGVDPDGFSVSGTCRDRLGEEHPVTVEWRTSNAGAYGEFDSPAR